MQMSVMTMLAVVACVALNIWLFRLGALWGILGLNVTKHVLIAALCQNLGVNQSNGRSPDGPAGPSPPSGEVPVAHARPIPPG